jgi:hypothetical protein
MLTAYARDVRYSFKPDRGAVDELSMLLATYRLTMMLNVSPSSLLQWGTLWLFPVIFQFSDR